MSEHALLSASSAHRWLNCTPSARLEEKLPEKQSEYADEGKLAHEIAELRLRKAYIKPMGPKEFNTRLKDLQSNPHYTPEMDQYVTTYFDYISALIHGFPSPPYVAVEKRLDYSRYVPEGFGTGDCIIIYGSTLYVIDLKYGKGVPVLAENNPQMLLYALGAYEAYKLLYDITTMHMIVAQVRLDDGITKYTIPSENLLAWGESIKPIAQIAYRGDGELNPGEWCRFCRAKALCRARANAYTALEDFTDPKLLSNEEIGQLLHKVIGLIDWANALKEYALSQCLAGIEIPGWKAVEGRSNRQFNDIDAAFKLLMNAGFDEAILYKREPLTVAEIEKLLGKTDFKLLLGKHVIKPPGKPTLAEASDKREAITNRVSAADDFGEAVE